MTIKQLKELIKDLPDTMDVFMAERVSEFRCGLVNSGQVREISFYEDMGDEEPLAKDDAFVLSEE